MAERPIITRKTIERTAQNANRCFAISQEYQKRGDGLNALTWDYLRAWKLAKMDKLLKEETIMG